MDVIENQNWKKKIYGSKLAIGEIKLKHYPRSRWRFLALFCILLGMFYNFIGNWVGGLGYLTIALVIMIAVEIVRLNKIRDTHWRINNLIYEERGSLPDINECISVLAQCQQKQFSEELSVLIDYLRKERDKKVYDIRVSRASPEKNKQNKSKEIVKPEQTAKSKEIVKKVNDKIDEKELALAIKKAALCTDCWLLGDCKREKEARKSGSIIINCQAYSFKKERKNDKN